MKKISISFNDKIFKDFLSSEEFPSNYKLFCARIAGEEKTLATSFDELISLSQLSDVIPYPHQIETAKRVLNELHGRAILADEVGLGKTIEAGLILKEYIARGLVKKALILTPASLVMQWTRELNNKFHIPANAQRNEYSWEYYPFLVSSMDVAKRDPHRTLLLEQEWDMVIVDEAHKLKNQKSKNFSLLNEIPKKFLLLLTATPIQNDMKELLNLVTLVQPGKWTRKQFKKQFMQTDRQVKNELELRNQLSEVMIRNKRSEGVVEFTPRHVKSFTIELSKKEKEFYEMASAFVREEYHKTKALNGNVLPLLILQRQICSSPYSALISLEKMLAKKADAREESKIRELLRYSEKIEDYTKVKKVAEIVQSLGKEKAIIFTEYRATQDFLIYTLKKSGVSCVPFRGGFKKSKKDWMADLFSKHIQVLVATEAGGEGINLQFCNHVINFDLPWNPMRLEQRIGRIHRIGQTKDVYVYNLATKNTVEEKIVHLLEQKIEMFQSVMGEMDLILGREDDHVLNPFDLMTYA